MLTLSQQDHFHIRMTVSSTAGIRYLMQAVEKDPALVTSAAFACGYAGLGMWAWAPAARTVFEALEAQYNAGRMYFDHWHSGAGEWVLADGGAIAAFGDVPYAVGWTPTSIREEVRTSNHRRFHYDRVL